MYVSRELWQLGRNSQNFLRQIRETYLNLGLKILRFLKLIIAFEVDIVRVFC
jgi:hypothetical protein